MNGWLSRKVTYGAPTSLRIHRDLDTMEQRRQEGMRPLAWGPGRGGSTFRGQSRQRLGAGSHSDSRP